MNHVERLLREVKVTGRLEASHRQISEWARAGDGVSLAELARRIRARTDPVGLDESLRNGIRTQLEDALIREVAWRLARGEDPAPLYRLLTGGVDLPLRDRRAATIASRVGHAATPERLEVLFRNLADTYGDLLILIAHEAACRGIAVDQIPPAAALVQRHQGHPLCWLPLGLTEIETALHLPAYTETGMAFGMPFGPHSSAPGHAPAVPESGNTPTDVTTPEEAARLSAAVANWATESNGQIESRLFRFSESVGVLTQDLLKDLGLECLREAKGLTFDQVRPDEVFEMLFAAAANGGAYSHGLGAAWGRLEAWRSMGALSGAPADASAFAVLDQVRRCRWYSFGAASPWFLYVAWDLGVAALRPGGHSVAILAATDTD